MGDLVAFLLLMLMVCDAGKMDEPESCSKYSNEDCLYTSRSYYAYQYKLDEMGTLAGDVQNWAMLIQNYITQVRKIHMCKYGSSL